jgi:hypothetical protein
MGVEEERDILKEIADLRVEEKELSEKVSEGINGKKFWRLEEVREEIGLLKSMIPSSGKQGMIGQDTINSSKGPEPGRFKKSK